MKLYFVEICKEIAIFAPDLTLFYLSRVNSDFGLFKLANCKFYDLTTRLEGEHYTFCLCPMQE